LILKFSVERLLIIVGDAGREGQDITEFVAADQGCVRRPLILPLSIGFAEIAAQSQTIGPREWITRLQIDRAAEAAFGHRGLRILVHVDAADFLARYAFERVVLGVATRALIRAFARHIKFFAGQKHVTVECRQVLSQAIDQYRGAFAGRAAIDLHAGQALQRFGHILVRHLADVLGRHGFDRQIGVALCVQCALQRSAKARDHDFRELVAGIGGCRGSGRRRRRRRGSGRLLRICARICDQGQ
jgi:hypothetical protein